MSKLSPKLKALIAAPFARPHTVPAPQGIRNVYHSFMEDAQSKQLGLKSWLTVSTAATMTMNSPESLTELHNIATTKRNPEQTKLLTELMREVGLKCISFNGIPRTINCLGAFRASLPSDLVNSLSKEQTRLPTESNIEEIKSRGAQLWNSIYAPFEAKLLDKLSESHPDLPVHILNSHYGPLLSDPPAHNNSDVKVGRVLTSIVAATCLRAQTGVGPQVISHLFGLRKAFEDGSFKAEGEMEEKGAEWLASDDGNIWLLENVDRIVEAIGGSTGSNFAPGMVKSKL